jgi:hypothetical protein
MPLPFKKVVPSLGYITLNEGINKGGLYEYISD